MVDFTVRCSLARHQFRPSLSANLFEDPRFRPPPITSVGGRNAMGEASLKLIQQMCERSAGVPRAVEARRLLEEALRIADGAVDLQASTSDQEPETFLAAAWGRLHLGKFHADRGDVLAAAGELRKGLTQTDAAWRLLLLPSAVCTATAIEPSAEVRPFCLEGCEAKAAEELLADLLSRMPHCLGLAAELAVKTRRALAASLMKLLTEQGRGGLCGEDTDEQSAEPLGEEISRLLEEADLLEHSFLPDTQEDEEDDPDVDLSVVAQPTGTTRRTNSDAQNCCPSAKAARLRPELQPIRVRRIATLTTEVAAAIEKIFAVFPSGPASGCPDQADKPLRGDILAYATPKFVPISKEKRHRRKAKNLAMSTSLLIPGPKEKTTDIFTQWREETSSMNLGTMTYVQLQSQTFSGMSKLLSEYKYESKNFKRVDLPFLDSLDSLRLRENSLYYNDYGMKVLEQSRQRAEARKLARHPATEKELQRRAFEKELFASHRVKLPVDKQGVPHPSAKDLRKLLHESMQQTSYMKEQRRREGYKRAPSERELRDITRP